MHKWLLIIMAALATAGCGNQSKSGSSGATNGSSGTGATGSGGNNGNGGAGANSCSPSSPGSLFGNALCLCGDLGDIGNLIVDGSGPGTSSSVGVDGKSALVNHTDIGGSYAAYAGLDDAGDTVVHQDLISAMSINVAGNLEVTRDLAIGGDLGGVGRVAVGGVLRVAGADDMIGFQQVAARGSFTAPASEPCPCDSGSLFDVTAAVAAAKTASSTTILATSASGTIGVSDLDLKSGSYYLADSAVIGYSKLRISGAVSLFVDGTIDEIGADRIVIDSGATLDLYVTGGVNTVGYAGIGDVSSPSSFRLYVGGSAPLTLSVGAQWFHGSIYAPLANLVYVGDTHVAGGLFAQALVGTGRLVIGGNLPGSSGGGSCPPPVAGPPITPTPPIVIM